MSIYVNIETGGIFYLEQTLESEYLDGRYGGVPIIDWGDRERPKAQFIKHGVEITDGKKFAKRLREIADEVEYKS